MNYKELKSFEKLLIQFKVETGYSDIKISVNEFIRMIRENSNWRKNDIHRH